MVVEAGCERKKRNRGRRRSQKENGMKGEVERGREEVTQRGGEVERGREEVTQRGGERERKRGKERGGRVRRAALLLLP